MQYAGLKALALKVSSFLVAKKSFRFHFFCNLVSGKLFLLSAVLVEIFGVKARTSQSRFPLYEILFQTLRKKFVEKLNDQRIKIPLFFFHWKAGIFMLSQTLQRDFAESFTFKAKTRQKFDEVTKKKIKNQVLKIELKKTNRF